MFCLLAAVFFGMPAEKAWPAEDGGLPSYYGATGLLDMPSARLMPDWTVRAHYSWSDPYATFGLSATFLPWLEINGRIIRISNVYSGLSKGYGDYKDKAIDLKIGLHAETYSWPAVALGATDIHGTGLFTSRYLCASKNFGPLDVTVGLGQGILAGESTPDQNTGRTESGDPAFSFLTSGTTKTRPFGGVELKFSRDLSVVAEYSSLDYEKLKGGKEPASLPFNFGLKYHLTRHGLLSASYMRGDSLGCSFSADFPLKPEGMLPWKKRPFWVPGEELKNRAQKASNEELSLIIRDEVAAERLSGVRVSVSDASVWVEINNPTYLSNNKALGRALRTVCALAPSRICWIYISLKSRDIILTTIKIGREDFEAFVDNRIDSSGLLEFVSLRNEGNELRRDFLAGEPGATPLTRTGGTKKYSYGLKPSWYTLLNDPSGFIKNSFSFVWYGSYYPWPGCLLTARLRTPLYNNISSSNKVTEKDPVRTDFVEYESQTNTRIEALAIDQVFDLPGPWLARAEAGLFESAYGGVGAELFRFYQDGRWGLGLESEWVRKRDVDNDFKFRGSESYKTLFLNIYYKLFPRLGVDVGLKLGRFLAGDWGGRLDVSRTYRYFTLGAWYTITDTDIFNDPYNRGYHDKGLYLSLPFSIFTDKDVAKRLYYGIRPWTRDPGQTVAQVNSLYPMANRGNINELIERIEELQD